MSARELLLASPGVERGVAVAAVVLGIGLVALWLFGRARRGKEASLPASWLTGRREVALLLVVVAVAVGTRTLGARSQLTVPFFFSETTPIYVDDMLSRDAVWDTWTELLTKYQVGAIEYSALLLPVAVWFQNLFGPSFHLPLLLGAFYGVAAVLLAWALGRAAESARFGLAFAVMLTASPLHLTWSRLGGIHISSVTHVLLVLWLNYLAGKRRSHILAVLGSLATWGTLYQYYAARIAIPLGAAALVAGLQRAGPPAVRSLRVLATSAAALAVIYLISRPESFFGAVWPVYPGYVGNVGEQSLSEMVSGGLVQVSNQLAKALDRYFLAERLPEPHTPLVRWGMQHGGLCLAAVAALGLVGLVHCVLTVRRRWLWLLVAAAGLSVPVLSAPTARRFLVFDVGWCALAADGFVVVVGSNVWRAIPPAVGRWATAAVLAGLVVWSFGTVAILHANVPEGPGMQPIPFGESGFGDGATCVRCLRAGKQWQSEIEEDAFVVLFDTDLERENPTIPGGLGLYGRLAALGAGRPGNFIEFYGAMSNTNGGPPRIEPYFDQSETDFGSFLVGRIAASRPSRVVWHFERPTQWERWLAARLEAVGSESVTFKSPLSPTLALQVKTPSDRIEQALTVVSDLRSGELVYGDRCPPLTPVADKTYPFPVLYLTGTDRKNGTPPDWVVGSWHELEYAGTTLRVGLPAGASPEPADGTQPARVHVLGREGKVDAFELSPAPKEIHGPRLGIPFGLGCAVRIGTNWWAVEPTIGALMTTDRTASSIPKGQWAGIVRTPDGRIALASASQRIVIVEPSRSEEVRRFAAVVPPSRRVSSNECTMIAAGEGWYATFDHFTSILCVYDDEGRWAGCRQIERLVGFAPGQNYVTSIAGAGRYLGVGYAGAVKTFEVRIDPKCVGS